MRDCDKHSDALSEPATGSPRLFLNLDGAMRTSCCPVVPYLAGPVLEGVTQSIRDTAQAGRTAALLLRARDTYFRALSLAQRTAARYAMGDLGPRS